MTLNFKQHLKNRPLSWSAISSFDFSPEQWYKRYILNEKQEENASMRFGKWFGEQIAKDPNFYPDIPRYPVFEQKLSVVFNQIPLTGFIDSYDPVTHSIIEYKTSKELWKKDKALNHGQLFMYALAEYVTHKKLPEKINLVCVKTKESGDFDVSIAEPFEMVNYSVKVEMKDILLFGAKIMQTVKDMESYTQSRALQQPTVSIQ